MIPGDLVVCVNNGVIRDALNMELHRLTLGDIYTVGDVYYHHDPSYGIGVKIVEIPMVWWWHSDRFRLCRETNIDALVSCTKEHEMENV